ncbi:MAG TPA: PadR family transcriptional regulator [Jiangellaceae bacterium]|nr:PadR family transcriptional regulator [Jiangellaceae bacterium]
MATARRNPLALAVLVLLYEQPMHPYQMSATLKERRKEDSVKINYGSLYSVVESLQSRGLIEVRETVRTGNRPERTVYAITEAGQREMIDWLSRLLSDPVKEFPQFEAALSLMPALPPDRAVELLERRLATQREVLETGQKLMSRASDAGMPRLFAVEHEYELAILAAEVDFLAALLDDMRDGSFSGLEGWRRIHELRDTGLSNDEMWAIVIEEFKEDFAWIDHADEFD